MRKLGLSACLLLSLRALAAPSEWVPMRWPWSDTQSLDLLAKSPVNTILRPASSPRAAGGAARGADAMRVVRPDGNATAAAEEIRKQKLAGLVLEGNFPPQVRDKLRD